MRSVYVITMWSGGRPAKKWKAFDEPKTLENGTGVQFVSADTKLPVFVIGNISVEEFESGKEEFESRVSATAGTSQLPDRAAPPFDDSNIERLF